MTERETGWLFALAAIGLGAYLVTRPDTSIYTPRSDAPGDYGGIGGGLIKLQPGQIPDPAGISGPPDPILPPTVVPASAPVAPARAAQSVVAVTAPAGTTPTAPPPPNVYMTPFAAQAAAMRARPGSPAPYSGAAGAFGLPPGASEIVGYVPLSLQQAAASGVLNDPVSAAAYFQQQAQLAAIAARVSPTASIRTRTFYRAPAPPPPPAMGARPILVQSVNSARRGGPQAF
jgi:hypothetical protein